jgi:transposase
MARFEIPDGWTVQAFQFALDCTPEQAACVRRQFGGRRYGRNWAVRALKQDLARYRETGEETDAPSLAGLRKRWNQVKDTECVDADTGQVWWPQISKEAFADGIKGAVDAYWNWQASRAGNRQGRRAGFPRFAKKGRDRDRVTYKTGWYGSRLVIADRWYTSSKTCHGCGHVQEIGWNEHWTCTGCGTSHQRDDNAAINLARYEPLTTSDSALGPVRAAVKRGADRKTRPRRAGGDETRKGPSQQAEKQPRDGVPMSDSL